MTAARWAQQDLLNPHAGAPLRVYAIWFNMYPGDARAKWPAALLTDPRVTHYWDEPREVGRVYLANLASMIGRRAAMTLSPTADVLWDAFFLYEPGDSWREPVPPPMSWGYPIMATRDQLVKEVDALLRK